MSDSITEAAKREHLKRLDLYRQWSAGMWRNAGTVVESWKAFPLDCNARIGFIKRIMKQRASYY